MIKRIYILMVVLMSIEVQAQVVITDADLSGGVYNWTADNIYIIDGYVFLEAGGRLNIQAGTVIKALTDPTQGESTSALIIARGAQIFAEGTADAPIIFTAEFDDVLATDDLTAADKGLWGGILILGNGILGVDGGEKNVEGIPSTETRALYGGSDNTESSGILKYVSIRHGGDKLGADDEINGLTLGAVGSGTTIDFVEIYANLDDGIEWFGGAVNVNHAVVAFCGDDSYDFDQSWNGKGQFWFSIQDDLSNRGGEWDGSERADLGPKASPILSNLTFIGAGIDSNNDDGNDALRIRDDGAAKVYNSIFTDFANGAIIIDNDADGTDIVSDSYNRFEEGEISFSSSVFYDFGDGEDLASIVNTDGGDNDLLVRRLTDGGSVFSDPEIAGISRINDGALDPRINASGAAWNIATQVPDDYFERTSYAGAFSDQNWAQGWTALSDNGYFSDLQTGVAEFHSSLDGNNVIVYPNPASQPHVNIDLKLLEANSISINLTDMHGRLVKTISESKHFIAGNYQMQINISDLSDGFYTINLGTKHGIFSERLVVIK